jgi:hypothetical protein
MTVLFAEQTPTAFGSFGKTTLGQAVKRSIHHWVIESNYHEFIPEVQFREEPVAGYHPKAPLQVTLNRALLLQGALVKQSEHM